MDHAHVGVKARRQTKVHDPVEAGAEEHDEVGVAQDERACRTDGQGVVVGHDALAHRGVEERQPGGLDEGAHLGLGTRPRHPFANDDEWALGRAQRGDRRGNVAVGGLAPRRGRDRRRSTDLLLLDATGDDVVGQVEVGRAGPAVPGRPHRLLDVERDPVGALDDVAVLGERGRRQHLPLLLERAHAVLVDAAGAADEDHRPVVLLGVGQAG